MITSKTKVIILSLILLAPVVSINAQTGTKLENRVEARTAVKQEIKDRIASTTERIKERVASTTEKIKERVDQARENFLRIAINRYRNVVDRFDATISREENIYSRIVSRIEKFKSAGKDTAEAEKFAIEAKVHIDEAKTALSIFKNASTTATQNIVDSNTSTSTKAKAALKKIKDMALTVEKHIKEARNSLVKAVMSLRELSNSTGTSTPSSN